MVQGVRWSSGPRCRADTAEQAVQAQAVALGPERLEPVPGSSRAGHGRLPGCRVRAIGLLYGTVSPCKGKMRESGLRVGIAGAGLRPGWRGLGGEVMGEAAAGEESQVSPVVAVGRSSALLVRGVVVLPGTVVAVRAVQLPGVGSVPVRAVGALAAAAGGGRTAAVGHLSLGTGLGGRWGGDDAGRGEGD